MAKVFDTPAGIFTSPRPPEFNRATGVSVNKAASFTASRVALQSIRRNFIQRPDPLPIETSPYKSKQFDGISVFSYLIIKGGSYVDLTTGDQEDYLGGAENVLSIDTVLLSINQSKNVVTTAIQGRDGTIKEYFSNGDYLITFNGSLVSNAEATALEQLSLLNQACNVPVPIEIRSRVLNELGITSIFIDGFSYSEKAGYLDVLDFTITAMSDNQDNLNE